MDGRTPEASTVVLLERAELSARARRLAAAEEADRIVAAGRAQVAAIEAGIPDRVVNEVLRVRESISGAADVEIEAIQREIAAAGAGASAGSPRSPDAGVESAAALIVAAVLGERQGPPGRPGGTPDGP